MVRFVRERLRDLLDVEPGEPQDGEAPVWNQTGQRFDWGTVEGPQGPQGIQGVAGEPGPQGDPGPAGADGDSHFASEAEGLRPDAPLAFWQGPTDAFPRVKILENGSILVGDGAVEPATVLFDGSLTNPSFTPNAIRLALTRPDEFTARFSHAVRFGGTNPDDNVEIENGGQIFIRQDPDSGWGPAIMYRVKGEFHDRVQIDTDGIILTGDGTAEPVSGVIVKSPDGLTTKRIGIDNAGNVVAADV